MESRRAFTSTREELRARIKRFSSRPKYVPVMIKQELTPAEISFVESHRDSDTYPEMELIQNQRRLYPRNGLAAHAIGYVGEVSEPELDTTEFAKYSQGDIVGKAGLERQYNDLLIGVDGQRRVVVDSSGREREVLESTEATPGHSLQLTLDLDLQAVAELALEGQRGAVVALDPRSGEVLAMVSRPAFDPNAFAAHITPEYWKELTSGTDNPMLNRAIQAQFAPGSTFKPIMALAGLETGTIDDHDTFHCPGGATFFGRFFKCWQKKGHGTVNVHLGIVQSCDVFFYNLGNKLGIDQIAMYAEMAGIGKKTGIDLPGEAEGLMPSSKWKLRTQRQKWYAGETISVAIGQGAVTVTPLQLATAIGGIVSGGVWFKPHMVKAAAALEPRRADLRAESVADDCLRHVRGGERGRHRSGRANRRRRVFRQDRERPASLERPAQVRRARQGRSQGQRLVRRIRAAAEPGDRGGRAARRRRARRPGRAGGPRRDQILLR